MTTDIANQAAPLPTQVAIQPPAEPNDTPPSPTPIPQATTPVASAPVPATAQADTSTALTIPAGLADLMPTEEEIAGIRADLDRIKMPGSGGLSWEIPGDDPNRPTMLHELVGTVLYSHQASALWLDTENANGEKPDAYSRDGVHQEVNPDSREKRWPLGPPAPLLADCPYNRFGSDPKGGKGKWTKNMRRVYFLPEGEHVPIILTFSPTGLKPYSNFYAKKVQGRGLVLPGLVVAIGLKRIEGNGNVYSIPTFEVRGPITEARVSDVLQSRALVIEYAKSTEIDAGDYSAVKGP